MIKKTYDLKIEYFQILANQEEIEVEINLSKGITDFPKDNLFFRNIFIAQIHRF